MWTIMVGTGWSSTSSATDFLSNVKFAIQELGWRKPIESKNKQEDEQLQLLTIKWNSCQNSKVAMLHQHRIKNPISTLNSHQG